MSTQISRVAASPSSSASRRRRRECLRRTVTTPSTKTAFGLEGVTSFTVGGERIDLNAGESLFIRRGVIHGFDNKGDVDARFLAIISPGLLGPSYFEEIAKGAYISARSCAESHGLDTIAVPKRSIWEQVETTLGIARDELRRLIEQLRREVGPPWAEDHEAGGACGLDCTRTIVLSAVV